MAEGTIDCYNLAEIGVDVDKAQIHKEDGALTKAQNATTDPTGVGGGVRKRPGLVEFNALTFGGSVLGGIGAALALLVNSINGTTLSGGPTRTTYWARQAKAVGWGATQGWWSSTNGFTSAAGQILSSTPANPRTNELSDGSTLFTGLCSGMPGASVVYRNKLYYASTYTRGTDAPPIRIFDGTTDAEFVRVPHNPNFTTTSTVIYSMLLVGEIIYLSTGDGVVADGAARTGRVFSLNPSSGALVQIGAQFPAGYSPYSLCWHAGRLWAGTIWRVNSQIPGDVQWVRPGIDTTWTLDRTMTQGRGCTFLYSYKGELFAGSGPSGTGVTTVVEKRTTLGAWSVSLSVGVGAGSGFMNAVQFGTNLYVTLFNFTGNASTVRKYDGASWTTALTTGDAKPLQQIWVDTGVIYAGGGGNNTTANLWTSTDGTSWTDRSTNLTGANMCGSGLVGTLAV